MMPARSRSQYRFMKMAEHSPEKMYNKPKGLSRSEAAEYTKSNTGKKRYSELAEYVGKKKKKKKY